MKFYSCFLIICGVISGTANANPNLIGHWKFDETSGLTAADSSSSGQDAVYRDTSGAGLVWGAGKIGGAASLDGASSSEHDFLISNLSALDGATAFTISGWFRAGTQDGGDN